MINIQTYNTNNYNKHLNIPTTKTKDVSFNGVVNKQFCLNFDNKLKLQDIIKGLVYKMEDTYKYPSKKLLRFKIPTQPAVTNIQINPKNFLEIPNFVIIKKGKEIYRYNIQQNGQVLLTYDDSKLIQNLDPIKDINLFLKTIHENLCQNIRFNSPKIKSFIDNSTEFKIREFRRNILELPTLTSITQVRKSKKDFFGNTGGINLANYKFIDSNKNTISIRYTYNKLFKICIYDVEGKIKQIFVIDSKNKIYPTNYHSEKTRISIEKLKEMSPLQINDSQIPKLLDFINEQIIGLKRHITSRD